MTSFVAGNRYVESMVTWQPTNGSATSDQQKSEQDIIVARSRDAWRNQLIAGAIMERLDTNVIGSGLVLKPKAKGKEKEITLAWEKWIKNCEYEDTQNFYELQSLVYISEKVSGDVFINTIIDEYQNLKLQVIEADRVCNIGMSPDTKDKIQGVMFYKDKPYAYSVQATHPGDVYPEYTWTVHTKYGTMSKRQRFFHLFKKKRPGQVRGIPIMTSLLETLRRLDKYTEAELTNAVVSNLFTGFLKSSSGAKLPKYTDSTQEAGEASTKEDQLFMQPGAIVRLFPDEDMVFANPNKPNPNYEPFINSLLKQIAACVGIPFDVLMMQFNDSYSASRASLMQFWKTVSKHRWNLVEKVCQPIYELWLENEVISGRISLDINDSSNFDAIWVGSPKGSIDDTKEIDAASKRVTLGISDIQTEAEEISGRDWYEIHSQRVREHALRKDAGLDEISKYMTLEEKRKEGIV